MHGSPNNVSHGPMWAKWAIYKWTNRCNLYNIILIFTWIYFRQMRVMYFYDSWIRLSQCYTQRGCHVGSILGPLVGSFINWFMSEYLLTGRGKLDVEYIWGYMMSNYVCMPIFTILVNWYIQIWSPVGLSWCCRNRYGYNWYEKNPGVVYGSHIIFICPFGIFWFLGDIFIIISSTEHIPYFV